MTVDAFRLKNFMAFRDTGWIELRAITLLFGRNSSGKSAIIRALRLLKQSLYNGQDNEVLRFAVEGQLDLGDFQAALHKRHSFENYTDKVEGKKITFQFRGDLLDETLETIHDHINSWLHKNGYQQLVSPESQPVLRQVEFSLEYGQNYDPATGTLVTKLVGIHIDCPWPILSSILNHPEPVNFLSASRVPPLHYVDDEVSLPEAPNENQFGYMEWYREWYWESDFGLEELALQEVATREEINSNLDWRDIVISATEGFFPTLTVPTKSTDVLYHGMNDFLSHRLNVIMAELSQNITKFLEKIEYLEPIRPAPERTYMLKRADIERWQRMGWRNWLNALQEGSPAAPPDMTEINLDEVSKSPLSIWMDTFELGQLLHVRRFSDVPKSELVAQVFILNKRKQWDNLKDVGYGASQILPIITTILRAPPGSIIIIEQPELHLHPKAQLKLAHLFLKAARRDLTVLVETHSEHSLLQLCFEAVEQTRHSLSRRNKDEQSAADLSENMMICFVSKEHAESSLTPIYLDDKGNLINETEEFRDFFVDDAKLVMSTLRSALEVEDLLQEGE